MIEINEANLIRRDIEKEMRKSFLDYSMSVIVSRALPDVRDGLKPVHRRILYTLHENNLGPDKPYRKCADTVGSVLGRYHPHGDASVYDALVRLAQDFSLRYPLVDGHGNFGSVDGDPPAAYRYTESRMSKIAVDMLTDIEKETVDFIPNYDDRLKEPAVLPSRYPNLLVNGATGIAVGMATNIPPHNMGEVIDAVNFLMEYPDAEMAELMEYIKGPDFPTGGIIMGASGIRAAYATGRGKITLRAKAEIEEKKNGRFHIVVTELPYMVNKARLMQSIATLVKDKRIEGISDLRDESDRDGMRMVVELKKDANPQVVLNQLYRYSQMQETVGIILLALADGQPKIMTLKEMLEHYIAFQCDVIRRRTRFDLRKAKEREHILDGLKKALDIIDEIISTIRASADQPSSRAALVEKFGFSELQAAAIVAMQLGRLSGLERQKIEEELAALRERIQELEAILGDHQLVLQIIREELLAIKQKYADPRRTEILRISGEVDIEDLIPREGCVITFTQFGYIKRMTTDTYKLQRRGGRGVNGLTQREEDFVKEMTVASSHDYMLFITNLGKMYRLKCYQIPEGSRTAKGTNIVNLLPLENGEKIAYIYHLPEIKDEEYLVMITKEGLIKRTGMQAFRNIRKSGLIALHLNEGDELAFAAVTDGEQHLLVATKNGMCIRIHEAQIREMSRIAKGVHVIRLREGDQVVGAVCVQEDADVMTVTTMGYGRRTHPDQYTLQNRNGSGKINYRTSPERGDVAGILSVKEEDELLLIADNGVVIRIRVSDVHPMSRYAGGVKIMRLQDEARLVAMAKANAESEQETEAFSETLEEAPEVEGEISEVEDVPDSDTEA